MNAKQILSDEEAADLLKMAPSRLKRLARAGKVPCIALPDGEVRFDQADLLRWVESHKREGGPE